MTELLNIPKSDPEVKKAYESLVNSDAVRIAMDKFKVNKKWKDFNAFCTLAEFGLTSCTLIILR